MAFEPDLHIDTVFPISYIFTFKYFKQHTEAHYTSRCDAFSYRLGKNISGIQKKKCHGSKYGRFEIAGQMNSIQLERLIESFKVKLFYLHFLNSVCQRRERTSNSVTSVGRLRLDPFLVTALLLTFLTYNNLYEKPQSARVATCDSYLNQSYKISDCSVL